MEGKSYKQKTSQGCLAVCLLILGGRKITPKREIELTIGGLKFPDSWALGVADIFVQKFDRKVKFYIHNRHFYKRLKRLKSGVTLIHKKIDKKFLSAQNYPFVLYIDSNVIGTYEHFPHFVVCETKNSQFYLSDSIKGEKIEANLHLVLRGVNQLKNHLKFCPLLITID